MDALLTAVLVIILLYNLTAIAWEYMMHRQLTALERKQANMQIGNAQMSDRIAWLEECVFELNRKAVKSQTKEKIVRKKQ